ncbi:SRPBCC family protein [Aureimonas populi]|uniref:SRPBCC domain-containing protein n=1 Tax=Aureimonas populi TaxID=1701758 RepID=A0ABW5CQA4_9HYPH|nr:SRPBCC domain-containing protein [Aureimonas populi]
MSGLAQGQDGEAAALAVRIDRHVDASPTDLWTCLTDPACLKVWRRENLEFDAREGGAFREPWTDPEGRGRLTRAQVTAFHPPRGLVMVWADEDWSFDTVVSIWIEPAGAGSLVTVEHQGWQSAPERERQALMQNHESGWSNHLANWATHAESLEGRRKGD